MTESQALELTNIGTLFAFVLVSIGVIVLRLREPGRPRPFKVPGYPVTPLLSAGCCILLMVGLPASNWWRFAIWLALGLAIYLFVQEKTQPSGARHRSAVAESSTVDGDPFIATAGRDLHPSAHAMAAIRSFRFRSLIAPITRRFITDVRFDPRTKMVVADKPSIPASPIFSRRLFRRPTANSVHGAEIIDSQQDASLNNNARNY